MRLMIRSRVTSLARSPHHYGHACSVPILYSLVQGIGRLAPEIIENNIPCYPSPKSTPSYVKDTFLTMTFACPLFLITVNDWFGVLLSPDAWDLSDIEACTTTIIIAQPRMEAEQNEHV